jgi:guanylate kinase
MTDNSGVLFIISGPSGVGKGTVLNETLKKFNNIFYSVSMTTRKPRMGEIDGVNYRFVSKETFDKMIEEGKMLEYAAYCTACYGTPHEPVKAALAAGHHVILEIETKGMRIVREIYPNAVKIFIVPPSLEILEKRIRDRGTEDDSKINARLNEAKNELLSINEYDHIIINDRLDDAVSELTVLFSSFISKTVNNSAK